MPEGSARYYRLCRAHPRVWECFLRQASTGWWFVQSTLQRGPCAWRACCSAVLLPVMAVAVPVMQVVGAGQHWLLATDPGGSQRATYLESLLQRSAIVLAGPIQQVVQAEASARWRQRAQHRAAIHFQRAAQAIHFQRAAQAEAKRVRVHLRHQYRIPSPSLHCR